MADAEYENGKLKTVLGLWDSSGVSIENVDPHKYLKQEGVQNSVSLA